MNRHPGTFVAGVVFVLVGVIYFIEALGVWTVDAARLWPIVLIAIGITVLVSGGRRRSAPGPATAAPEGVQPEPVSDEPGEDEA